MAEQYSDEELEEIRNKVQKWYVEFSKSKQYRELTQEQKQEAEFVIMAFTEFMYSYCGLLPEEWDEEGLEECCLDTLPRKITADESYYRSIPPVLSAFFTFAEERGLLKDSLNLARRVMEISGQILKNAAEPRNWGMAKSFVTAAKNAGVNIHDKEELKKFLTLQSKRRRDD